MDVSVCLKSELGANRELQSEVLEALYDDH